MSNSQTNNTENSKKACERIREVFAEAIKTHPTKKDVDWNNDDVLIEEFTDEWTWYMQGCLDATQQTTLAVEEKDHYKELYEQGCNIISALEENENMQAEQILTLWKKNKQLETDLYHDQNNLKIAEESLESKDKEIEGLKDKHDGAVKGWTSTHNSLLDSCDALQSTIESQSTRIKQLEELISNIADVYYSENQAGFKLEVIWQLYIQPNLLSLKQEVKEFGYPCSCGEVFKTPNELTYHMVEKCKDKS